MRRAPILALVGAAAVALAAAGAYTRWFAPEESTVASQPLPEVLQDSPGTATPDGGPVPLRSGSFQGADGFHYARGTVALYQMANGTYLLRFDGYEARDGPDVYLYLTQRAGDDSAAEVEGEGLRIRVPGGEGDGRATVRGSFNVFLPEGVDATGYGGITIWCDDFNQFFGHAALA